MTFAEQRTPAVLLAVTESASPTGPTSTELSARFHRDVMPLLGPLYRQAVRITHNHADAEDLVQDNMVKAYANFHSFLPGTNLNAWLRRIMTNLYINAYRKKLR
jgi:RNA polymerase sigma-70 factor (ECF subfamily)